MFLAMPKRGSPVKLDEIHSHYSLKLFRRIQRKGETWEFEKEKPSKGSRPNLSRIVTSKVYGKAGLKSEIWVLQFTVVCTLGDL